MAKYSLRTSPRVITERELCEILKLDKEWRPKDYWISMKNEFEVNDTDTVADKATGLIWQRTGSNRIKYAHVKNYIDKLNQTRFGGFEGWRLPTIEELLSLLKKQNSGNYYIDEIFSTDQFWCFSTDTIGEEHYTDMVWGVRFGHGDVQKIQVTSDAFVRTVKSY